MDLILYFIVVLLLKGINWYQFRNEVGEVAISTAVQKVAAVDLPYSSNPSRKKEHGAFMLILEELGLV